jgi:hypothetical protein
MNAVSKRAVLVCGLCGALSGSCTNSGSGSPDAATGASSGPGAGSLAGTWNLTTSLGMGSSGVHTTVTIGQDSLSVMSPSFTLTATRTGNVLAFTDNESPGASGNAAVLTTTQTAGTFNAGIVPFDLGGSWTMQAGPKGGSPTVTCTLTVSAAEIDGACQQTSPAGPWFSFTTQKMSPAASSFGDFGGKWTNTWTTPGMGGGTFPCTLDFTGNGITTCAGGAMNGQVSGSPLAGITFTYDGANTVSGSAQGWAEFSATR